MSGNEDTWKNGASEMAGSQDSGPMSFDEDDMFGTGTQKQPAADFNSDYLMPASEHQPRPQFLENGLRSIQEIPEPYRQVFGEYPCFNRIQSMVMDAVFYSSDPLVVTAPTGSGKTVIFELAMIHLLMSCKIPSARDDLKIVYMAPVKALCTEKLHDWARKFARLNINCLEVTGDSDITDLEYLKKHHLILTTPEKWDSLTRRWRDHASLMKSVRLFMIDEVHILNEETRGPTLEAVVSRMKMLKLQQHSDSKSLPTLRFIAVSATIPNVEDLAQWLGTHDSPAKLFKVDEEMRPVKLKKIVKGYDSNFASYMFDVHLSYKLKNVITQYSEGKPTLVFCSTRKSVIGTAEVLAKMITFNFSEIQRAELLKLCDNVVDKKIKESVKVGIGCHHAGLVMSDRNLLENAFRNGLLPVLIATSTLAMGVNLPAHLVVIKSTQFYGNGGYQDYSDSQLLQMIGRAGRPQFDTSATAVIMTRANCEDKYRRLTAGTEPIQSSLHRHLVEHLNAEVVLGTVTDLPAAVDWIRSTFLFVRANRQPQHYGLAVAPGNAVRINAKLQDMMQVELNALAKYKLVETDGVEVRDTPPGRLMARYYVAFQTMKAFLEVQGDESLGELLAVLARAAEFQDVQLRQDEKAALNALNSKKDGAPGLRFPIKGRIKDRDAKVNCLLQALLGGLAIAEPALQQEAARAVRTAERLSKCLCELVQQSRHYRAVHSALLLHKCVRCQLWEDSPLAARQLPRIGPVLAQLLASAGKTTLERVAASNPRDLERIINRLPPFGNELRDAAAAVPKFTLSVAREPATLELQVDMANADVATRDPRHWVAVLVGDDENRVVACDRFPCAKLLDGTYSISLADVGGRSITAHVISEMWVGVDAEQTVRLREPSPLPAARSQQRPKRKTFLDKMKEAASRMDDTPSYRLQANQGLSSGSMTLSQRFEQFKQTQAKKLEHGKESAPPPTAGPSRTGTRTAPPTKAAAQPVVEDLDPWDEWDGGELQVVPDDASWTPKMEPVDAVEYSSFPDQPSTSNFFKPEPPAPVAPTMEYSKFPNQPTIRNFFKPEPPAPPPTGTAASFSSAAGDSAPAATRFDLDDSWDWDILVAVESGAFVPVAKASPASSSSPPPGTPPRTDKENWAGVWNINFDIGIEELLRSSDDEAAADDSVAGDAPTLPLPPDKGPARIDEPQGPQGPASPAPLDATRAPPRGPADSPLQQDLKAAAENPAEDGVKDAAEDGVKDGVEDGVENGVEDNSWMSDSVFLDLPEDTVAAGLGGSACVSAVPDAVQGVEEVELAHAAPASGAGGQEAAGEPDERRDLPRETQDQGLVAERGALVSGETRSGSEHTGSVGVSLNSAPKDAAEVRLEESSPFCSETAQGSLPVESVVSAQAASEDAQNGQIAHPRPPSPSVDAPARAETVASVASEEPFQPGGLEKTPRKEQPDASPPDGVSKGVKEEHRVAKAKDIPSFDGALTCVAAKRTLASNPSANRRGDFEIVATGANPGSAPGLRALSQLGQRFQVSMASVRSPLEGTLLKPQQGGAEQPKDDVLAKLLADWSSRGQQAAQDMKTTPVGPAAARRPPPAAPGLHGALLGCTARRTPTGTTTAAVEAAAPADVMKVDCVERILQEDFPRQILNNGKDVVRPFNTDRLRAARAPQARRTSALTAQLSKQLSQLVPPPTPTPTSCRPGLPAAEPAPAAAAAVRGTAKPPEQSSTAAATATAAQRSQGWAAATSVPSTTANDGPAAAPDWIDRILSEPPRVRRHPSLLQLQTDRPRTAKRKADDDADAVFKRPAVPSMWQQMAQVPSRPPQPTGGALRGTLQGATSTRTPPAAAEPARMPAASSGKPQWTGAESHPFRADEFAFRDRRPSADDTSLDFPRHLGRQPCARRQSPMRGLGFDDLDGELNFPMRRGGGRRQAGQDSPPRARHRAVEDEDIVSPMRFRQEGSPAGFQFSPPTRTSETYSPFRCLDRREGDFSFEDSPRRRVDSFDEDGFGFEDSRRRADSFEERDFGFERSLDRSEVGVDRVSSWHPSPASGSPSSEFPLHDDEERQWRREDDTDSPVASFWARRGSPSYSPAPPRAFNWCPALSPRHPSREEDPFAYVPQATLPATRRDDAWCCTPRPPSAETPSAKMILSLSPAVQVTPPANMSKWDGYLG